MELTVLLSGEAESEQIIQSVCICDENCNYRYRIDYNKFMVKVQTASQTPATAMAQPTLQNQVGGAPSGVAGQQPGYP